MLERARFPSFDGLRALAILPVVLHHSTTHPLDGILGRGPLGVDLFFALSGFLITTLLLREKAATSTIRLGAFWGRRALRIMPLYYVVLAIFVVHAVFVREPGPVRDHFLRSLPVHLTYTSNFLLDTNVPHAIVFGFGWSLSTEEQFYLVWPLVLRFARRTSLMAAFMIALFAIDQLTERGYLSALLGDGTLFRAVRSISTPIVLGASATDFPVPGDYDGDGKMDVAVWKPSTGIFTVRRSSDGVLTTFAWGQSGDRPVANFQVH